MSPESKTTADDTPLTEALVDMQKEVQRKLGRNLLRLQQCELLLKHFVIEQEISGPASDLGRIKQERHDKYSGKSMGLVVKDLTGGYIMQVRPDSEAGKEEDVSSDMPLPWMKMNSSMQMSRENFERTKDQLSELVTLRNGMVHHFLEHFDLSNEAVCSAADDHLDELFKQINEYFEQFRQWHDRLLNIRGYMAQLMNSPEYIEVIEFMVNGVDRPGAGVDWPSSPIVQLLRDAENTLAKEKGGWTSLKEAIEYIGHQAPEQIPKTYGCSSWRQVIHESRQFDVHKEKPGPDNRTKVLYRSRA